MNKFFLKKLWVIWRTRSAVPSASLRAKGFFRVTREEAVMAGDGMG